MRVSGTRTYYRPTPPKMPPGLVNLIQDLSRDVLKNNPTDIYGYCANHFKQLLEIRDGPLQKKKLTLEEKIAKAQEKVRQRAEQRRQQYDNEMLKRQRDQETEIKASNNNDTPIPVQEAAAIDITPLIHKEQELVNSLAEPVSSAEAVLSAEPISSAESVSSAEPVSSATIAVSSATTTVSSATTAVSSATTAVSSAPVIPSLAAVSSVVALSSAVGLSSAAALSSAVAISSAVALSSAADPSSPAAQSSAIVELSNKNDTPPEDYQISEVARNDKNDLKLDMKADSISKMDELKGDIFTAEANTPISDNAIENPIIVPETKIISSDASETLNNMSEPVVEVQVKPDNQQSFEENEEFIAVDLQETDKSSPINDVIIENNKIYVENVTAIKTEPVTDNKSEENDADKLKSSVQPFTFDNNNVETQPDEIVTKTQHSNVTENIKDGNVVLDYESQINTTENGEKKLETDDNKKETDSDSQETNQFEISFKESPTVELQGSQVSSDVMESLLDSNTDNEIMTLVVQESSNGDLEEVNGFNEISALNSNIHTDSPQSNKVESGQDSENEKLQENHRENVIDNAIEDNVKNTEHIENNDIRNNDLGTSKLSEATPNNQDNMDLETAAVTIQKVFRSFLFKSRTSTLDETVNDETMYSNDDEKNKEECDFTIPGPLNERRPHGITRMDTVLQTVNEEKSLSLSDDSSTLSSAATIIQAHVRGFLVRNKLYSNKTISTNSQHTSYSNEPSLTSLEMDNEQNKNKTVLNIHIVPEGGNYLSRDESLITSMDLSLDSSPPSSINLHPLGYDKSERRKQLKREDAIQSISPPSNNSGKLSEDVDSVKELNDSETVDHVDHPVENNKTIKDNLNDNMAQSKNKSNVVEHVAPENISSDDVETCVQQNKSLDTVNSDELDVVTPFESSEDNNPSEHKLIHSGEFHDAVLPTNPTKVSRSDTTVASGE
ncbi:GATA zinc finger domain-containing protein 14-like isoform X2 [Spodoptera litura]|uniref:GATA zinc finger domain-containing protein 14-like isoform X2 n=1 Tax=Spodoptera litura TaxID=69820 RepID=A0A9J7IMB9_SPOLT|nr:GATA zinc finger domain-containing protein 14-like isoform X2 [Spodoptera litura]